MTVGTAYSSSDVLHLGEKKQLHIGDFAAFPTPKCFFLPNTNVLLHTHFLDQGSGKSSLVHTEETRSFSENIPECFTLRFCHNYFLKAVVWRQTFWFRCPGTAVTPLSFLKWKLSSSRAPHDPKPPSNLLRGPSCTHWGEDYIFTTDDKAVRVSNAESGQKAQEYFSSELKEKKE